jgi:hypothetical protein
MQHKEKMNKPGWRISDELKLLRYPSFLLLSYKTKCYSITFKHKGKQINNNILKGLIMYISNLDPKKISPGSCVCTPNSYNSQLHIFGSHVENLCVVNSTFQFVREERR